MVTAAYIGRAGSRDFIMHFRIFTALAGRLVLEGDTDA